jgi:hypothetical protein
MRKAMESRTSPLLRYSYKNGNTDLAIYVEPKNRLFIGALKDPGYLKKIIIS